MNYRRSLGIIGVGFFVLMGMITTPAHVFAATLTNFSYSATSYVANATSTYTFSYTTATVVNPTSNYVLYFSFPYPSITYNWNASQVASNVTVTVNGVAKTIDTGGGYLYVAGSAGLLGIPLTTSTAAGSNVVVTVQNVINPAAGTYTFDPALSASFIDTATGSGNTIDGPASINPLVITAPPDTTSPSVTLTSPTASSTVVGSSVPLTATATDNIAIGGVTFYVDGTKQGSEITSGSGSTYTTTWNSTATSTGIHTAFAVARDTSNNHATSTVVSFTVDNTQPTISAVANSTTAHSATVGWTTSKPTSSQVFFGPISTFSTSTPITNTNPLVINHSVTIPALLACTNYLYQIQVVDGGGNTATSSISSFITPGCGAGTANVLALTSGSVTSASGATKTLTSGSNILTAVYPTNVTATSTQIGSQIKQLDGLGSIPMPSGSLSLLSGTTYDVSAFVDATTTLDSFLNPVTITIQYDPSLLGNIDPSSLTMYHYHGGQWIALTGCANNTTSHTVSCQTSSFSTFALFGTQNQTAAVALTSGSGSSSGAVVYGCKDPAASNYTEFAASKPSLCVYGGTTASATPLPFNPGGPMIPAGSTTSSVAVSFSRNLQRGMSGSDVTALQKFLISANGGASALALATAGTTTYFGSLTKAAVTEYQKVKGITPASGYFGPLTRAYIAAH